MTANRWNTRAETEADRSVARDIVLAAFPTDDEANLVDALRLDSDAWSADLSVVAVDDSDAPVGHALLTRCHIGDVPALCLAPCSVAPEMQNRGAGSAAIGAVIAAAKTAGERFVVVLGHPEYYPRFGFEWASEFGVSVPFEVPDEALMVMSLDGSRVPSGVVEYAAAFGV